MRGFQIRRNDRVFFVGQTGSGKTTLAKALMWDTPYIVVLDPKRLFTLPDEWPQGYVVTSSLSEAASVTDARTIIYRPSYEELLDRCNEFFAWIFERENTLCYIDEVQSITPSNRTGYWAARCIQEGREHNIAVWSATQRPAAIPLIFLTEAQHVFVFRLNNPDDRKRMGDYGTITLKEPIRARDQFGFRYYNGRTGKTVYYPRADIGRLDTRGRTA